MLDMIGIAVAYIGVAAMVGFVLLFIGLMIWDAWRL